MQPADNELYEGDCIEVMRQWEDGCVDHCLTDPPYNMSKKNGLGWAFSSHVTMSEQWDIYPRENYLEFAQLWLAEVSFSRYEFDGNPLFSDVCVSRISQFAIMCRSS